ncbi:hypothetical protein OAN307_c25520 [Octadecabacter antarcticus 307]|uniref:Uncharacterized protein n=1 Tax=Octadecabacter antarcticus 307 TaxID=391626 RepID=M9R684_9RHOB|nr:hypothetical protein OAN307_c25520 [Octadecabacter antarcticus 307]
MRFSQPQHFQCFPRMVLSDKSEPVSFFRSLNPLGYGGRKRNLFTDVANVDARMSVTKDGLLMLK